MPQKYYNTAETAKLLGKTVEEVKQMLESRELHGYRDGADWKFKVEDIDRLVKPGAPKSPAEEEEEEGGDVLLSEVALGHSDPGLSGTVIGMSGAGPIITDSDIRLAESDIQLGEESKTPIPTIKSPSETKFEELDLTLDDGVTLGDSSAPPTPTSAPSSIDIGGQAQEEEDDLVLADSSVGSDVTIGGDSGISLIDPSDSGLSLETPVNLGAVSDVPLDLGGSAAVSPTKNDELLLTPLEDESPELAVSDSQAPSDAPAADAGAGASLASMLEEDLSAPAPLDLGLAASLPGAPVLGGSAPGALAEGAALQPSAAAFDSSSYTGLQIAGLAACTVVLLLCGMMMYDLVRNMWGWEGASSINSGLMDTILGWFGI